MRYLLWYLYKQVIPPQMLVVTISMQDKGCKMVRVDFSLVALAIIVSNTQVNLPQPLSSQLAAAKITTSWLK